VAKNKSSKLKPHCLFGVDTCDGPTGTSGFICRDCAEEMGDPPMRMCSQNCPSCGAPCERNSPHGGQCNCINCGTKWYGEEETE
jgi:hypothetical protein